MSKRKNPFEEKIRAAKKIKTEGSPPARVKEESEQNNSSTTSHSPVNSIPRKNTTKEETCSPQKTEKYKSSSTKQHKEEVEAEEPFEKKQTKKKPPSKATKTTKTRKCAKSTKATKDKTSKKAQKRKSFARKPINKALIVKNPKIRVIKLYSRFDSVAKAKGN